MKYLIIGIAVFYTVWLLGFQLNSPKAGMTSLNSEVSNIIEQTQ